MTNIVPVTVPDAEPHIKELRLHMMQQLRALRAAAPGDALAAELQRTKGVQEIAQVLINSAKMEIDYLIATKQPSSRFLETPPDKPYITGPSTDSAGTQRLPGTGNGILSITRHNLLDD